MSMIYLPGKVKDRLGPDFVPEQALVLLRSSSSMTSNSGEGYVIALDDEVLIFSRELCQNDYQFWRCRYDEPGFSIRLTEDGFQFSLSLDSVGTGALVARLVRSDRDSALKLIRHAEIHRGAATSPGGETLAPKTGFLAALLFVAGIDGKIDAAENDCLRRLAGEAGGDLTAANCFYQEHSWEELLMALEDSKPEASRCILANMIELAMCDGSLSGREQNLIWAWGEKMGIPVAEIENIFAVLLLKNRLTVLE